mmetsp:Transcript_20412/g.37920  ORF Transcript_20412/g.37920 Transcript_20412/m.37920 type:complete len:253 (-) Transcript_20412:279-1037(-)
MSKFSVSPVGLKGVGTGSQQTKFTNLIKSSNQSRQRDPDQPKQTKFTDMISSSNHSRSESERQKDIISALTAQVSELTKTHTAASDTHLEREKELMEEQKATANKLLSVETVYKKLSTDHSGLQLQFQEVKDSLEELQRTLADKLQAKDTEITALQKKCDACNKENEEMLASWDSLRIAGEEQTHTLGKQEAELKDLTGVKQALSDELEKMSSSHESLTKEHDEAMVELATLRSQLATSEEALTSLRQSLME